MANEISEERKGGMPPALLHILEITRCDDKAAIEPTTIALQSVYEHPIGGILIRSIANTQQRAEQESLDYSQVLREIKGTLRSINVRDIMRHAANTRYAPGEFKITEHKSLHFIID